jgi:diacylglycerol kinase family enzyme
MRPQELYSAFGLILAHSPAFPGERLAVDLIANPKAGGFTRPKYSRLRGAELNELLKRAESLPKREGEVSLKLHLTERCGHAADIARELIEESRSDRPGTRRLVLAAGGDGTSLETASVLVGLPVSERGRFSLLRLPFGTGNDGSEGRDLRVALGRFLGPLRQEERRAIRVTPNPAGGKPALYSFNIASLGASAFICHMTNKLKTLFPGDSYKFWVDFSSVFYDKIWPPASLSVRAWDASGTQTAAFERECMLVAYGASGRRDFGSGKHILPDEDNACAVFQMPLLKKLDFKDRITAGKHRGLEFVKLFKAERIVFDYKAGLLMERDGEVNELAPADFPLTMEITEPLYNVLVLA